MKITFEVPDTTICLILSGVHENPDLTLSTRTVSTDEIISGEVIVCDWKEE